MWARQWGTVAHGGKFSGETRLDDEVDKERKREQRWKAYKQKWGKIHTGEDIEIIEKKVASVSFVMLFA
jgi:hypothetical protein